MRKGNWSWIIIGALLISTAACKPTTDDDAFPDSTVEPPLTPPATAVAQLSTATPIPNPIDVPPPPPRPTPQPTSSIVPNWQKVGRNSAGLELQIPSSWSNLSGSLDVSSATNPLGLSVILLADSERTGRSLLAAKELSSGAFGVGLIISQPLPASDPSAALTRLISDQGTAVTPLTQPQPITATASSGIISGAMIDVNGDPLGFFNGGGDKLRARLLLFPAKSGSPSQDGRSATLILLSAPADLWSQYASAFDQMAGTLIIHDNQTGYVLSEGGANVVGELAENKTVDGTLDASVTDVWTFTISEARYVTLSLVPEDENLDLSLVIINPAGQTITRADNGYAGDTEAVVDILLTENGRYVVEVSDFFNEAGRYTLSLILDEEPRSSGGGKIRPGQGIQSELPVNAQHIWTFDGAAGQLVSIVLTPGNNQMDAILNLYGPDGQRLVALDEGFSGDPEVISGFELPVSGAYTVVVSSFAGNGGVYTLSLDEGGEATQNFYDAGDLVYGDIKRETLRKSEAHAWFFQGRTDDAVRIAVRPLNDILDLEVWLFDPDIQRLAARDDLAAGDTEIIELTLPRDGQYLIFVREFFGEAGSYEVELSATPAATPVFAGRITFGETVTGALAPGQMAVWVFNGDQMDVVDIDLQPGSELDDVMLALQDPQGNQVLELDKAVAGQSEKLNAFTITADGQWGIIVKDFFEEGGTYSLSVQRTQ